MAEYIFKGKKKLNLRSLSWLMISFLIESESWFSYEVLFLERILIHLFFKWNVMN
jgi:hypothetical protein